jgi:rhodanese-related sulfurtransferase
MESRVPFLILVLILFANLMLSGEVFAKNNPPSDRAVDPVVSTDWLEKNLAEKDLVILDIRSPDDFGAGHIAGSINEPFATGFTRLPAQPVDGSSGVLTAFGLSCRRPTIFLKPSGTSASQALPEWLL